MLVTALLTAALPATARVLGEVVTAELENPWGVVFLPEGRFLVSEKAGRLRVVEPDGRLGTALQGLSSIASGGQGGMLDVVANVSRRGQLIRLGP